MPNDSLELILDRMVKEEEMQHTTGSSPYWPRNLFSLYFRPHHFFSSNIGYGQTVMVICAVLLCSFSSAVQRIAEKQFFGPPGGDSAVRNVVFNTTTADSWAPYWMTILFLGLLGAVFVWWLGGWWFKMRLRFSGVSSPNALQSRLVYVYSVLVLALPVLILTIIQTFIYNNSYDAYNSEELYSSVIVIFPFWSMVTSYKGARSVFGANRWKARIWFIILPALVIFAGLVVLFLTAMMYQDTV